MHRISLPLVTFAALAFAQRPTNTSICDYYTTALFTDNTAANQYALVSAVVNRAAIGNSTSDPVVVGIVNPGTFNGADISLAEYFTGAENSTNRGGTSGVAVNFLDGGGAEPLMMGMAANSTSSRQYTLFTHLYTYFGSLLGCSNYGMEGYAAYSGSASMFEVHKFMGLDENEVGYFIQQVGLSASSFGVTDDDVSAVGTTLSSVFNVRCAPNMTVIEAQGSQQQSICIVDSCPLAVNSTCDSYAAQPLPVAVSGDGTTTNSTMSNSTVTTGTAMGTATGTTTGTGAATQTTNAAANMIVGGILGAVAFVAAL